MSYNQSNLYILFEHAAGYSLFNVREFEEIGMLLPQVEASVTDLSRFNQVVKFIAFSPFRTQTSALESINSISEGIAPENLILFLESNLVKPGKKFNLGVSDAKLAAALNERLEISCTHIGVVSEIIRGIRTHFSNLVKGFDSKTSGTAQLGLGHSYSRAKVKFNMHRDDNNIIQIIALIDQLDRDINTQSMRIREWNSYHFPELVKIIPENFMYAKVVQFIKDRKDLNEDKLDDLEALVMDRTKAQAILDASRSTMGMDISHVDLRNIERLADQVVSQTNFRNESLAYLKKKISIVAPNLTTIVGDQVGARLIAHAGSLTNLAKAPASTVQILGAEKALFRALKTKGNTPKYGLLFHSSFIGRAGNKNKGRISRFLANKCALASKIDCFSETPMNVFGEKLRQQVEDRLKFYESGDIPKKNIDVMTEARVERDILLAQVEKKKKKKKKKSLSESVNGEETTDADVTVNGNDEPSSEKKKKKKKRKNLENGEASEADLSVSQINESGVELSSEKKKKKKRKSDSGNEGNADLSASFINEDESEPVKKKKKKKIAE